jgi:guanine nucleotide-binding protein subunit alpha
MKALQKSNQIVELSEDEQQFASLVMSPEVMSFTELTSDVTEAIENLWKSEIVKKRFLFKSDVQIIDSASYFFDNIKRISEGDYVPTDQDILYSRTRTTGITEFCFHLAGTPLRLVDVGGQRSERRKWIHCFDDVTAIFFIVAISEFDQRLREDETTNRLKEAINLFQEVCDYDHFANTSVILFLNKSDLFEQKLERGIKFSDFLPELYNGPNEKDALFKWLEEHFKELARAKQRSIYTHITCATNTENVETVFGAVQNIFMKGQINEALNIGM